MSRIAAPTVAGVKLANGAPRWLFFAIFTISGFSGLIYESIWSHYLKLFLGHAAYAQSLVLIIFMGGLAAGSWLAAKYAERWRAPILYYAIIEGVIGVIALVFHDVFAGVTDAFYSSILPAVGNPALGGILKWIAAAALIVPQTVLLGMTFPLLSTGILRRYPDHPGGSIAMLYFTNSIGAAFGVLASGFWLIGLVGLPGTILTAGLLNIALALVVWMLVKLDPHATVALPGPTQAAASSHTAGLAPLFFFAAGITGAASFIYEIGWIRMLSLVLGATTHSFELMLSAFITGLAFGGLWIKHRIDRISNPVRFAGWVQVIMGVLAVATVPLYVQTFDWMSALLSALQRSESGYTLYTAFSHGIALIVMVPTTFLAGMTLPLFTHVLMRTGHGEGSIGRVYAANTVGSILGVLFAVHVGMPLLGLKSLIGFGAALDVLLGLALLYRSQSVPRTIAPVWRAALVGGAALALVATMVDLDPRRLASGVYRYRWSQLDDQTTMLFYKDGKTASISLIARDTRITISTNGKPDASIQMDPDAPRTTDEITMIMAAALPLAYHPQVRQVANIGLGSGLTTHTFLADERIERVDTIEIESAMVQAARGFGDRVSRTFEDPRSRVHLEDAKTFFSLQQREYDIIIAEPSNPWVSGVASLFSTEFYKTIPNYLTPDGVFVQWLQLYEFNNELAHSVLKALSENFSDFAIYNTDNTDILIVAKPNGRLPEPRFDHLFNGVLGAEIAAVGLRTPADFLIRKSGSKEFADAFLARSPIPVNSDYFPFLDLHAGKARFQEQVVTMFQSWGIASLPALEMIGIARPDLSTVSADENYYRTMMIQNARTAHSAVTDARNGTASPFGAAVTVLELLAGSCAPVEQEEIWLLGLHTLAQSTLAFLPPADATSLLDTALPAECVAQASDRLRAWTSLYHAVARRDPRAMAHTGVVVMNEHASNDSDRSYAMAAAMLGYLVDNRPELTIQTWEERPPTLQGLLPAPELDLILHLARAHVADGAHRPAAAH